MPPGETPVMAWPGGRQMKKLLAVLVAVSAVASLAQAAEPDLGGLIARDIAKRRRMVALEDAGTNGAVLGARYASTDCRRTLEAAILRGEAKTFGLVGGPVSLDPTRVETSFEAVYKLDQAFTSRNKANIALLAKIWGVKADVAADLIRKTNISFTVYRKRYPAFDLPKAAAIGATEEALLAGMTPPAGTVVTPYEVLFVTDFKYTRTANNTGALNIAADAAEKAKAALSVSGETSSTGNVLLPDNSAVAFKPIVIWDRPGCRAS
jgi:hypothetical protein